MKEIVQQDAGQETIARMTWTSGLPGPGRQAEMYDSSAGRVRFGEAPAAEPYCSIACGSMVECRCHIFRETKQN